MKSKIKFLFSISIPCLFFLSNCNTKEKPSTKEKSNTIVLLYDNVSIKDTLIIIPRKKEPPLAKYNPVISFTSNEYFFDEKTIIENSKDLKDTIRLNSDSEILIKHKYNVEDLYFIAKPGDTLTYKPLNGIPAYDSKRHTKLNLLDFKSEALLRNKNYEDDSNNFYFNQIKALIYQNENENKFHKDYLKSRIIESKNKNKVLDSLKRIKKISKQTYLLHKNKLKFDSINLFYNKNIFPNKDVKPLEVFLESNGNLLIYGFYKEYLHNLIKRKFKIGTKKYGNATLLDAKQAYDSISNNSEIFTKKTKAYLLYYYLNQIIENDFVEVSKKYINEFKKTNSFESLTTHLNNKYLVDFYELKNEIDSVYFVNEYKKKIVFKDFLNNNKGKIIFVDFWASWCAPCRKAIPDSKKLITKYKNKDIIFVYISIDKNFNDWQKALKQESLLSYKYSFMAVNYPKAEFYKNISLKSIPRYLIFDKNGILIHNNAPSPTNENFTREIDKYFLD